MNSPTERQSLAMKSLAAWIVFLAVLAGGLTADLWSKSFVFARLSNYPYPSKVVIPHVMRFTLSTNPGIVFGLEVPPAMVLAATTLALVAVIYFFVTSPRKAWGTQIALGMILAGALGNMYDRLFSDVQITGQDRALRQVRDFIDFSQIHYPYVFNFADVLLVVGVVILVVAWLVHPPGKTSAPRSQSGEKASAKN